MPAAVAYAGMLLTSLLVGELAALALGDFFGASDEFPLVLAVVGGFAVLSIVTLGGAAARSQPQRLNGVALLFAIVAVAVIAISGLIPWIGSYSSNPYGLQNERLAIGLELAIPVCLTVLVQWGVVRRHLLRGMAEDDLTVWPWVATALATLVLLNPFGLAFLQATIRRSSADFMWPFAASVTAGMLAALVVIAALECYIRRRILRRRHPAGPPSSGGIAGVQA